MIASGRYLDPTCASGATRLLLLALDHNASQIEALADSLAALQAERGDFSPVVVMRASSVRRLRYHGFVFEWVIPEGQWQRAGWPKPYPVYLADRLRSLHEVYRPRFRLTLQAGTTLTSDALAPLDGEALHQPPALVGAAT